MPPLPSAPEPVGCRECLRGAGLDFDFTMAFHPIVDAEAGAVWAHEALVRGTDGASAAEVLARVTDRTRYRFDQACRVKAIELAARLQPPRLSINFLPNAVYRPETCIRTTLEAAREFGFPVERMIFEVTEGERIDDKAHLAGIIREYRRLGFATAIDDFGAGHSGLNLLAEFQPDFIKLDMALTRGIHRDPVRRAIVQGILGVCAELRIEAVAEGIELAEELAALRDLGLRLFQGFWFAEPGFESLPAVPPDRLAPRPR
ncbi:MAG TPA: EAL domain-containing protein [Gemmatimonadales bacterium]|nr:EAL domain-containing protein [Gemmatimonadales bacterium]